MVNAGPCKKLFASSQDISSPFAHFMFHAAQIIYRKKIRCKFTCYQVYVIILVFPVSLSLWWAAVGDDNHPTIPSNPIRHFLLSIVRRKAQNDSRRTRTTSNELSWNKKTQNKTKRQKDRNTKIQVTTVWSLARLVMMICRTIIFQTSNSCNLGSRWAREEPKKRKII